MPDKPQLLKHMGTEILTVFGVEDEDGNIIPLQGPPIRHVVHILSEQTFASVVPQIAAERVQLTERVSAALINADKQQRAAKRAAERKTESPT